VLSERVVCFGPGSSLVGIETLPAETRHRQALPAVVLLNAGVVHRIGPHRMTVTLARQLAQSGFHVLRYDTSGLGDSLPRSTGSHIGSAIADARDAMDFLAATAGHQRFVFGGLCSGADNSVRVGLVDRRVVGMILLDPHAYRTPRFYLERLLEKCENPARLAADTIRKVDATLGRWTAKLLGRADAPATAVPVRTRQGRKHPPKELFGRQLRRLTDRGVRILATYTGGAIDTYNYPEQFADCFRPFGVAERIETQHLPKADHTFTEIASQRELTDRVLGWLNDTFAQGRTAPLKEPDSAEQLSAAPVADTGTPVPEATPIVDEQGPVVADPPSADLCPPKGLDRAALLDRQLLLVRAQLDLIARLREERARIASRPRSAGS
jgi:hypothetical protein